MLGARDRLEAVARKNPATLEELESVPELKRWQRSVLGEDFLKALAHHRRPAVQPAGNSESPYRE